MKPCYKCHTIKSLDDFYRHKGMSDGHLNMCKICFSEKGKERLDVLKKDPYWLEGERKRCRNRKLKTYEYSSEYYRERTRKYNEKYPEKLKCKHLCQRIKPEVEGNILHHWSYNIEHAKNVIEITQEQHYKIHRLMTYDQPEKKYRDNEGNLLSTRYEHEMYIHQVINRPL